MIVNEEDFDALVEAVENAQMRLADTFMLRVMAQLLDVVEEMHAKVEQMYEFLSSEDEEEKTEISQEQEKPESKTPKSKKQDTTIENTEVKIETEL